MNNFIIHHLDNKLFHKLKRDRICLLLIDKYMKYRKHFFLVYLTSDYNYLILKNVLCINSLTNSQ